MPCSMARASAARVEETTLVILLLFQLVENVYHFCHGQVEGIHRCFYCYPSFLRKHPHIVQVSSLWFLPYQMECWRSLGVPFSFLVSFTASISSFTHADWNFVLILTLPKHRSGLVPCATQPNFPTIFLGIVFSSGCISASGVCLHVLEILYSIWNALCTYFYWLIFIWFSSWVNLKPMYLNVPLSMLPTAKVFLIPSMTFFLKDGLPACSRSSTCKHIIPSISPLSSCL